MATPKSPLKAGSTNPSPSSTSQKKSPSEDLASMYSRVENADPTVSGVLMEIVKASLAKHPPDGRE